MKQHHRHIPLLIFAISVTLFVFGLYGYMYYNVNLSLSRALAARDAVVKEQSLKLQEQKLTETYEATVADRAKLNSFFVSDTATISFIEAIENLGKQAGAQVTITSIESDNLAGKEPGTLGSIRMNVVAEGSWTAVMRTLKLAEVMPYKVSISRVSMNTTASSESSAGTAWSASFVIQAALLHEASL